MLKRCKVLASYIRMITKEENLKHSSLLILEHKENENFKEENRKECNEEDSLRKEIKAILIFQLKN